MNSDWSWLLAFVARLVLGGIVVFLLLRARVRRADGRLQGVVGRGCDYGATEIRT
jgi:hypothetical protein